MGILQVVCPNCQAEADVDELLCGSTVPCKQCGREFVVGGQPVEQRVAPPSTALIPSPPLPPPPPTITGTTNEQLAQSVAVSPLAVVSLVLGFMGCFPLLGLAGLICGIVALGNINNSMGRIQGKGLATSGIATSLFMMVLIFPAILIPIVARGREMARETTCMNNQRQIAATILMYAQDHNGVLPDGHTVWPSINVNAGELTCPTAGKTVRNAYGYNQRLSNRRVEDISTPAHTIVTADGGNSENLLFGSKDVNHRHSGYAVASYIDGHVGKIHKRRPKSHSTPVNF